MYVIELQDGREVRHHVDHIRHYTSLRVEDEHPEREISHQSKAQAEILQQAQYSSQIPENPIVVPTSSDSLSSNTEQVITDDVIIETGQTEPVSNSQGVVAPDRSNPDAISGRRVSAR